jgi:adenylyltransferase/sulfurtransferase
MIVIVGCGTLGSRVAHKLKEHRLTLIDHDVVYEHNLETQKFSRRDIGTQKVYALMRIIPTVRAHNTFLDETNLQLIKAAEVVVDCTDNLVTRKLLGQYCYENGIPLIHAAAAKSRGIVGCFVNNPCLQCVYDNKISLENCRGSEIDTDLAQLLADTQAELTQTVLDGEEEFFLALAYPDRLEEITVEKCEGCDTQYVHEDYYITWCPQADALSAKRLKKIVMQERKETHGDITVKIHPDGELHFFGSENIDDLKQIAHKIYQEVSHL